MNCGLKNVTMDEETEYKMDAFVDSSFYFCLLRY